MTQRKPIVLVDGRQQQIQSGDTLGGISAAVSTGEAMVYDQFGANASHMTPTGNPTFDAITGTSDATIHGFRVGYGPGGDSASLVVGGGNSITTATSVTAIGPGALGSLTTGNWNTAAGQGALATLVGGQSNVAIGNSAGHKQADDITNITSANSSIYIGSSVRGFGNNDSYAIVIGAHAAGEAQSGIVIGSSYNTVSHLFGTPTFSDGSDATKKLTLSLGGITTSTTRTVTLPDASGTMTLLGNASTGSGSVVLATSPTLVTPTLGAATATTINGVSITGSGTLATGSGNTLTLSGTSSINQNVTTTGTPQFDKIGVGTASISSQGVRVITATTGAVTQAGVLFQVTADSGATTAVRGCYGEAKTAASSFTCTTVSSFWAQRATAGSGSTITNCIGYDCDIQTAGGTLNASFRGINTAAAGRWNLYMSGNAANAMAGKLAVGSVTAPTATLEVTGDITATTSITSTGTGGVGYATGAGGTVTQATSRTTGVTLNKTTGAITLVSAAGSASWQTFTVTNSTVAATDVIVVNQKSGTDLYMTHVTNVAAGSFKISFATTGGTTTEQPVFSFAVIKGATA